MREELNLGYIPCSCRCGQEATIIFKGVPLHSFTHYEPYLKMTEQIRGQRRLRELPCSLEHFTASQINHFNRMREMGL